MENKSKVVIIENNKTHFNLLRHFLLSSYETNDWVDITELIKNINHFCSNKTSTSATKMKLQAKSYLIDYFNNNKNTTCFILDYQINEENGKEHINIDSIMELMKSNGITNFIVLSGKMEDDKRNDYRLSGVMVLEKIENWNESQYPRRQEKMKSNLIDAISKFSANLSDQEILKDSVVKRLNEIRPTLSSASTEEMRSKAKLVKELLEKIDRNEILLNSEILNMLNTNDDHLVNLNKIINL